MKSNFVTFTCMGCGAKEGGEWRSGWHKPDNWYERADDDGPQLACSRECIKTIASRSGKTKLVMPI